MTGGTRTVGPAARLVRCLRTGRARRLAAGCILLAAALSIEGYVRRSPYEPAARDIDASVKHAQTLALADSHLLSQSLPYRAEYLDSKRWFLPFVKPFILRTRTGFQSIFPTMAALIDVPFELVGGNAGIRLLSILGVIGLAFAVGARNGLRADILWPLVLGFATPLWFYALGATGPPVAVFLAMVSVFLANVPRRMWLAGILLGLSSALRDETLALAPGILLFHVYRHRSIRPALAFCAGIVVPITAVAALDSWLYGRPPAAHLLHAVKGTWFSDAQVGPFPVLSTMTFPERFDAVFVYWLDGHDAWHVAMVAVCVGLAAFVKHRWDWYWGTIPILALFTFDAVSDGLSLYAAPRRLSGLLRLAPFLVFAALPAPAHSAARLVRRQRAQVISAVFLLVAVMTTNTTGGKALGPRLALPVWPLLAFAAWSGIRQHMAAWRESRGHRVLGLAGVALVCASFANSSALLIPVFRAVEADASAVAGYIYEAPERVVVIGSPFAIDPVIASYSRKAVMLVTSADDARDIARRLVAARIRSLLAIRRNDREDVVATYDGFSMVDERHFGRWVVQRWAR